MNHLTPEQLDEIVSGTPGGDAAMLRRHLGECGTCARQLADRARFEEQLETAAARIATSRRTRGRIALAVAAAFMLLLGAGLAMRRSARPGEVAQAQLPTPSAAPVPVVTAVSSPELAATVPELAASVPGLAARIPRPCEDVVAPAEPCRDPDDPTCSLPEVPAAALSLP